MARYVLLEIDDDTTADELVAAALRPGGFFFLGADGHFRTANNEEDAPVVKVPAVWAKPTKFCDCKIDDKAGKTKKYGWYVHTLCKKPRIGTFQHPKNLIAETEKPTMPEMYLGFRLIAYK